MFSDAWKGTAGGRVAHRLRGTIGAVFRFAIATVRAAADPTYALRGALPKVQVVHRAAITDEKKFGALLASISEYDGWPTLKAALQLALLTMTRPGEVRHMKRTEIDLEGSVAHSSRAYEDAPAT